MKLSEIIRIFLRLFLIYNYYINIIQKLIVVKTIEQERYSVC